MGPTWLGTLTHRTTVAPPPIRLGAIAIAGFSIGSLHQLVIATTLADARSTVLASAHFTAAIGIAQLVAPAVARISSDVGSPRTGLSLIEIE